MEIDPVSPLPAESDSSRRPNEPHIRLLPSAFPATVGQLICWTKVTGAAGDATIHHVWFHGDTQVGDVELHVGGSPWRTWSRKTIPADGTGAWHVEIRDAAGTVLRRIDFRVGQ